MTQKFKGDEIELKYENSGEPILTTLSAALDDFFSGAYDCEILGSLIYDTKRSPLVNAIKKDVYVTAFNTIFNAFVRVGTFEGYIDVFKKIFGDDVIVNFTVPAPGELNIDITANDPISYDILGRQVVSGEYHFYDLVDSDGNFIIGVTLKGFQTEDEVLKMLFEMVPAGIYTTVSLTLS